jgi:DNA-directed RNA polymerase subunit RPC12/RpoP
MSNKKNEVKIKTKCIECGSGIEQDRVRSMKRCPGCGKKWYFSINIDGTVHLFRCRPQTQANTKKRQRSVSISPHEEARAKNEGYGLTKLLQIGYDVAILGVVFEKRINIIQ